MKRYKLEKEDGELLGIREHPQGDYYRVEDVEKLKEVLFEIRWICSFNQGEQERIIAKKIDDFLYPPIDRPEEE